MFFGDQPITFLVAHFSKFHDHFFRTKNSKVCWIRPAMTLTSTWESEPPKPWSYDSMKRTMFLRKFFTLHDSTPLTTPSAIITPVSLNWAPGPGGKWQTCTSFFVGIPVCQYPKGYREHEKDDPGNVFWKNPNKNRIMGNKNDHFWGFFCHTLWKGTNQFHPFSRVGHIKIRLEIFPHQKMATLGTHQSHRTPCRWVPQLKIFHGRSGCISLHDGKQGGPRIDLNPLNPAKDTFGSFFLTWIA